VECITPEADELSFQLKKPSARAEGFFERPADWSHRPWLVIPFGLVGEEAMGKGPMEYAGVKRSIVIKGHKTSVTLEDGFWSGLREIAREKGYTLSGLVAQIDSERVGPNLSSAIRMHVLEHYKALHAKRYAPQAGQDRESPLNQ